MTGVHCVISHRLLSEALSGFLLKRSNSRTWSPRLAIRGGAAAAAVSPRDDRLSWRLSLVSPPALRLHSAVQ